MLIFFCCFLFVVEDVLEEEIGIRDEEKKEKRQVFNEWFGVEFFIWRVMMKKYFVRLRYEVCII